MSSFLDYTGLSYFWGKVKALLNDKVDKVSGKGLSTNDYTTTEKNKLSGIEAGANKYTHPAYTAKTAGLYKVTVDATGHVSAATAVAKSDITGLGIPAQDTTYSDMTAATSSAAGAHGLVPAPGAGKQESYLRGDGTWAVPTDTDTKVNVTLATTTKAYLLATSTTPTSTAAGVTAVSDTGVYLDTAAGKLTAGSFAGDGANLTALNGSNISSGTVAAARIGSLPANKITSGTFDAARLPVASASSAGVMSAADYSKLAAFGSASDYALKSEVGGAYVYKGSKASASALPTTGNTTGDVWNVEDTGMNYAWTGTAWDALGMTLTIDSITNAEIDTMMAS